MAASILIALVMAFGTVGYVILGLSVLDAAYQTAITVTTVGFGEVTPDGEEATTAYRVFTLGLVLAGAAVVLFAASVFIEAVIANRLPQYKERRMQREIDLLNGHLIVCGYGRVGTAVANRADGLGGGLVIIDSDDDRLEECRHLHLVGDATTDSVLRRAGVERAASLVAALATDADNVFLAVSARSINPRIRLVSRANGVNAAEKLRTIGMDHVVEPYDMAGDRLATAALRPHTSDYLEQVFSHDSDHVELSELEVSEGAELVGSSHTVAEAACGVVVVAVRPHGKREFLSTSVHAQPLAAGDIIIALGDREGVERLSGLALAR